MYVHCGPCEVDDLKRDLALFIPGAPGGGGCLRPACGVRVGPSVSRETRGRVGTSEVRQ